MEVESAEEATPVEASPTGATPREDARLEKTPGEASPIGEVSVGASPMGEIDEAPPIEEDRRNETRAESVRDS